jgi:hypothetical protein
MTTATSEIPYLHNVFFELGAALTNVNPVNFPCPGLPLIASHTMTRHPLLGPFLRRDRDYWTAWEADA